VIADISERLAGIVGAAHVLPGSEGLEALGQTPGAKAQPHWFVRPGSGAEVAEVVRLAVARTLAIVPVGGGSRPPAPLDDRKRIFIDCRRMNHVLNLDETSLLVHAQAGLHVLALERLLEPRGLSIGDYPPQAMSSTLGGLLAVRTSGKSSRRHGFIEEAILGLSAVLPDGRAVHTKVGPKRATGPDLNRALCGSEGTLGIITSAVLRIHRQPETRFFATHRLPGMSAALRAVRLLLREEVQPSALRLYDGVTARSVFGSDACTDDEALLLAATAGPTDLAACDRNLIASAASAEGGVDAPSEFADAWWARRTSQEPSVGPTPNFQVSAAPSKQLAVYEAILSAVQAGGGKARTYLSRFDLDGAVVFSHIEGPESLLGAAEEAAAAAGGFLPGRTDHAMALYYGALKKELDPLGLMNPGGRTTQ